MKKIIIAIVIAIVLLLSGLGVYTIFFRQDKDTTLTLIDKQWIEENKNQIIDLSIINNIPIYNYNGKGVIFDFINKLEEKTGLEFNKIPYSMTSTPTSEYAFKITNSVEDKQLLIYEDNYAVVSKKKEKYNSLKEIPEMVIGVLESDLENVNYYLQENKSIKFVTYSKISELTTALKEGKIDSFVIPKTIYLNQILDNDLSINYNIADIKTNLVLELGNNDKLNNIIKKYFNKWYKESYEKSYSEHFTNYYFNVKDIDDDSKVAFLTKQYKYGFVDYAPFDKTVKNTLVGTNNSVISSFSKLTNIDVKYYEYNTIEDLISNFNSNKIDLYFNISSIDKFEMDTIDTVSISKEEVVVLSHITNKQVINTIYGLKNKNVMVIKDTKIAKLLQEKEIETKEFKTLGSMLNNVDNNYLIVLDKEVYNTYKMTSLKEFEEIYSFNLNDNYSYKIRDIKENKVFADFFNFYLSYIEEGKYINEVNYKMFHLNSKTKIGGYIILVVGLLVAIIGGTIFVKKKKTIIKKTTSGVSKENRIKYIDMLTSLKNRNYLNDSIEKWDECGVYPQAIVIVDLNNVAYINDNYGHAEGDNVIKEAASILFSNQIENSEIMRTNGNEFLIYLVNYDEKQVVAYTRKLSKEFKELSHGFGAAIGYSMINDGLKTIDDAINEATLDMKTNKEEAR